MKKVSVILTSYNHDGYIAESIESILNQSFNDFELVIIDDCSTDNSWEIINSYEDSRIIKIKHPKNIGDCLSKELINSLTGEYIAIAHCDDKWKLDKLQKQVEYLDENKDVTACFTKVQLIDEFSKDFMNENHYYYKVFEQDNRNRYEWLHHFFYHGNCLCHPSLLIRKDDFIKFDLFTIGLYSIPDFYKWVKICFHKEIYILPEKLSYFRIRINGENTSSDTDVNRKRLRFEELIVLDEYCKNLDKENLPLIFPESKQYYRGKDIHVKYAFARILRDESDRKTYQLYGLQILYQLINDAKDSKRIEDLYSYVSKSFRMESSEPDIFGEILLKNMINTSLFYDTGSNFNENEVYKQSIFTNGIDKIKIVYEVKEKECNGKFRLDPNEGVFHKFKDVDIRVNNQVVPYKSNGIYEEEWISFYTTDPIFTFNAEVSDEYIIEFVAQMEILDLGLVDLYIKTLVSNQKKFFIKR